jgi:hypothetical protein
MKKALILFVAMATSTSAFAFTAQAPTPIPDSVNLVCVPPLDRHDTNPDVRIHVTAEFDSGNRDVKEFDVIHELFDETTHNRSDQYTNAGLNHKTGYNDWYWTGTWVKNHSVTMIGHLYNNQQGWFYAEAQSENGNLSWVITSPCHANEAE